MLQLSGIAIDATSVGGLETCIQLPGLKLALDIGRCPRSAVLQDTVLITHGHMDHIGGVCYHAATRGLMGLTPPTYVIGPENEAAFKALFNAYRRLDRSRLAHELIVVGPGERIPLRNNHFAVPFRSIHRVPCQGYSVWSSKKKLKAEYQGLSGHEIRDLRVAGKEITDTLEYPVLSFTGDSLIEVLEKEEVVRKSKVLVMEVTFVDDRVSVEQCRSKGHIHLDEVVERAELFENESILFTHFSARYSAKQIIAALDEKLPPGLRERVTPLVHSH
jgi:ribonuclease Z